MIFGELWYICKYIVIDDFNMYRYIYDDKNGLWFELQKDYYIPMSYLTS